MDLCMSRNVKAISQSVPIEKLGIDCVRILDPFEDSLRGSLVGRKHVCNKARRIESDVRFLVSADGQTHRRVKSVHLPLESVNVGALCDLGAFGTEQNQRVGQL